MCQDRAAARQIYWIGTVTSGHHNVAPGSSQERSARGGAAAAVLGRYGGGWVAMGRGSGASGLAVVLREWRVGFEAVSARLREAAFWVSTLLEARSSYPASSNPPVFFGGETQFKKF